MADNYIPNSEIIEESSANVEGQNSSEDSALQSVEQPKRNVDNLSEITTTCNDIANEESLLQQKPLTVETNYISDKNATSCDQDVYEDSPELTNNAAAVIETDNTSIGSSYESIMSVCSDAAQQIKKKITEVLQSREHETESSTEPDDFPLRLEEKIADFEKTIEQSNSVVNCSQDLPEVIDISKAINETDFISGNSSSEIVSEFDTKSHTENQIGENSNSSDESKLTESSNLPAMSSSPDNDNIALSCQREDEEMSCQREDVEDEERESSPVVNDQQSSMLDSIVQSEKSPKKAQKSSTGKRKGEKTADQVLKSLSSYTTTEDKLQVLCKKHTEILDDLRSTESRLKQGERHTVQLIREKEQLQAEHNRTVLAKSRLESLCRELQRQNKAIKEESLLRIREEEEKRKEVASKFQTTLNDISTLMQENSKKNLQLKEENAELAKKLKSLVEHYEMWEKHMEKVVQQKDLEAQLAKAKLAKTNLHLKQETEKFLREKQSLLENMSELQKKCTELASNELQLRTELSLYTSKYEEFQTVLNKSNQVFASFKTDMETTSKKIKKLEKETNTWKQKWENSNRALLDMIADKEKRDKELLNAQQRILKLEKLCRALQAERNDLHNQIKGQASTVSSIVCEEDISSLSTIAGESSQ